MTHVSIVPSDALPGDLAPSLASRFREAMESVLLRLRSPESRRAYASDWRQWLDWCDAEGVACTEARPMDLARYLQSLADAGAAQRTVRRKLESIRQIYGAMVLAGLLPLNPSREVRAPRVDREENTPWLVSEELARLLRAFDGDPAPLARRNRLVLLCLAGLGLRRAEVARLAWPAFRETPAGLSVTVRVKGGKTKTFGVPPTIAAELRAAVAAGILNATSLVTMWTRSGEHFGPDAVAKIVREAARRAGLAGKATPHALRRTLATLASLSGAPLEEIQATLGHAHQSTTEIYIKQSRLPTKPVGEGVIGKALGRETKK